MNRMEARRIAENAARKAVVDAKIKDADRAVAKAAEGGRLGMEHTIGSDGSVRDSEVAAVVAHLQRAGFTVTEVDYRMDPTLVVEW